MSKVRSVSTRSPKSSIPLAERRRSFKKLAPTVDETDGSFSSSDEDDVRDEYESTRRGRRERGSRQSSKRDKTFETAGVSKVRSVSTSGANGYVPLAERRRSFKKLAPTVDKVDEERFYLHEDDVRDEYESTRRGQRERRSRQFIQRDRTFESVDSRYDSFDSFEGDNQDDALSIFDAVDFACAGKRPTRNDRRMRFSRYSRGRSYLNGYAM